LTERAGLRDTGKNDRNGTPYALNSFKVFALGSHNHGQAVSQ
jgi:hypothetical protein